MAVNNVMLVDANMPVEGLSNYSIKRDSTPLDPSNTSMAIPSASFQVQVPEDDNPEELMGKAVIVTDRQNLSLHTEIVDYSLQEGTNQASLDTVSIFARLNTEQTCLPIIPFGYFSPEDVLTTWAQECAVFGYRVPGIARTYVSGRIPLGYERDSNERWMLAETGTYRLSFNGKASPPFLGPSQALMFGTIFSEDSLSGNYSEFYYPQATEADIVLRIERNGNTARLLQSGVVLGTVALPDVGEVGTPPAWDVHVLAQVPINDVARVNFTMRAVQRNGTQQVSSSTFSQLTGSVLLRNRGYNKIKKLSQTEYNFFVYMSDATTLPTTPLRRQFDTYYGSTLPTAVTCMQGFTGNVWSAMREFCSIYGLNLVLNNDLIDIKPLATPVGVGEAQEIWTPVKSNVRKTLSKRTEARKVEVVRHKLTRPASAGTILLWKADSVYSLERGETKIEVVDTDATFLGMVQPVAVGGVPVPYESVFSSYVITGADGYIVDPQWWVDNGGSMKVAPTRKSGQISITMQAPNVETVRAPYRVSEGVADRPALYITGNGVVSKQNTIEIYTGSPRASQEVGITFDSPFVTDIETVYRVGARLAHFYGGTESGMSYTVPLNSGYEGLENDALNLSSLGFTPETAYVYHRGAIYRNSSVVSGPALRNVTADNGTTIEQFNEYWSGKTVADFNTYFAGKLVRDVNRAPLPQYLS